MTQTLTVSLSDLATLAAGDCIVAIDGEFLAQPLVVELPLGASKGVRLAHESPTGVEWYLYPHDLAEAVTIERSQPAQPDDRQLSYVTVRRYGIPLRRYPDGAYTTEDGRYRISRAEDGYVSECDGPHPVRIGRAMRDNMRSNYRALSRRVDVPAELLKAIREGRNGYQCPGGYEHARSEWCIWDVVLDDYLNRDPDGYDTLAAAVKRLMAERQGTGDLGEAER